MDFEADITISLQNKIAIIEPWLALFWVFDGRHEKLGSISEQDGIFLIVSRDIINPKMRTCTDFVTNTVFLGLAPGTFGNTISR